jgi:hypothetical protein
MTKGPFSGPPKNDEACSIDGNIALSTRMIGTLTSDLIMCLNQRYHIVKVIMR